VSPQAVTRFFMGCATGRIPWMHLSSARLTTGTGFIESILHFIDRFSRRRELYSNYLFDRLLFSMR
jgi:hypothetical protein